MRKVLISVVCVLLSGCFQRWVDAPPPTNEGDFLIHVVRAPDETLPKILTWYTGTTLSQPMVVKYNPYLLERDVKVGDRVVIPVEVVANANPYGTAPERPQAQAPNLLMGESVPNLLMEGKKPAVKKPEPSRPLNDLPAMSLETFNDDTNPDAGHSTVAPEAAAQDDRVKQLQEEIADKQRELEALKGSQAAENKAPEPGDEDMPPPGLLREYEGS